jgi:hypothetical protein
MQQLAHDCSPQFEELIHPYGLLALKSLKSFSEEKSLEAAVAKLQQTLARDFQVAIAVKAGKAQTEPSIHA